MPITREDGAVLLTSFTGVDLLFGECPNKHIEVFGFYPGCAGDRVQRTVDQESMELTLSTPCRDCGCVVEQKYPLHWEPRNWQI